MSLVFALFLSQSCYGQEETASSCYALLDKLIKPSFQVIQSSFQGEEILVCNLQYGLTDGPVYHVYKVQYNSEEP